MVLFPNAKINIGLYVTGKRADGYHNIETVFVPVPQLYDVLEAVAAPDGKESLTLSGLAVSGDQTQNLVWKAYKLLQDSLPEKLPSLHIYLHKVIPMGAGLGGGSADGAFALKLLNEMHNLGLTDLQLESLALQLGSDCPFFIRNSPQFAGGRGEVMEPIAVDLSAYDIRVEAPGIHVSTAEAFRNIVPRPASFDLRQLATLPVSEWRNSIGNDFEIPVFRMHPEIGALKEKAYADGAVYAQMSGSGSAVYAIYGR